MVDKGLKFLKQKKTAALFAVLLLIFELKFLKDVFATKSMTPFYGAMVVASTLFLTVVFAVVYVFAFIKELRLERLFCFLGVSFGIFYLFMIPIYCVPDEQVHYFSAYAVSNEMLGIVEEPSNGILMRADDCNQPINVQAYTQTDFQTDYMRLFSKAENEELVQSSYMPLDTPNYQYYLPAIGITIGRLFHLSTITTFMFGRVANLLLFLVAVTLAIRITPIGKQLIFVLGLMPMTMQQAASYSYDAFINAFAFLSFAALLRIIYTKEEKNGKWEYPVFLLLCVLLLPTKHFSYFPLPFLMVPFLFSKKTDKKKKRVLMIILAILLVSVAVINGLGYLGEVNEIADETTNYIAWAGEEGYTIGYFLQNPLELIKIAYNTLRNNLLWYLESFAGGHLGWLIYHIPNYKIWALLFMVVFATVQRKSETVEMSGAVRVYYLVSALLCCAFAFAGMLFAWTPISSTIILGVQGRYFIPAAPAGMIAFKDKRIRIDDRWDKIFLMAYVFILFSIAKSLLHCF